VVGDCLREEGLAGAGRSVEHQLALLLQQLDDLVKPRRRKQESVSELRGRTPQPELSRDERQGFPRPFAHPALEIVDYRGDVRKREQSSHLRIDGRCDVLAAHRLISVEPLDGPFCCLSCACGHIARFGLDDAEVHVLPRNGHDVVPDLDHVDESPHLAKFSVEAASCDVDPRFLRFLTERVS
jgi:hypothetical protein